MLLDLKQTMDWVSVTWRTRVHALAKTDVRSASLLQSASESKGRFISQENGFGSNLPRPSNVVPFGVWYGFLVRILIRTTKKVLHWRV